MDLEKLGKVCRNFRNENGITVQQVADLTGYSVWNIYVFEKGGNDNAGILLAYVALGLKINRRTLWQILRRC